MSISPLFDEPIAAPAPAGALVKAEPREPAIDIFTKATVLQLQFRRPGTERKVSMSAIDIADETADNQTDRALLKLSRTILDSPELKAIAKHDSQTAAYIDARKCGPAFANQGGFHLVALAIKPEIDRWVTERLSERSALIDTFIRTMPERFQETRKKLGPLGTDLSQPSARELAEAFGITCRYMSFGYTDEKAAEDWRREALTECRAALRGAFADLVSHLSERLQPGENGKPKVFRDSLVEKFDEFIKGFADRNLADDGELFDLVCQAREVMNGVSADNLRKQDGLRDAVAARVAEIKTAVDQMVTEKPTRAYADVEE